LLDVSDLKRSLEEVKHARDYAEAIVNTIREPLVVLNQDLEIQNANRAFFEILEVAPGTAVGRTIYVVGRGRFDLAKVRNMFEQLERGSAQLSDVEIEYQPERGDRRTLVLNVRRLWTPGQKHLILVAFEDITERKNAAEARYRRLFETARDGIVLVDAASGEILDLNPFTEHLLGYSRAELVGRKLWEIEVMRDVPQIQAAVEQVRDQGALKLEDLVLRTKEGREVQTAIIASTYLDGERRAIQFNIRDVSERKKFERELRETQKLESLGLMAGGIAHDFNNLLTGIIGNASLAYSESAPDAPQRRRLHEIIQTGERAAFLTRQMLAYAGRGRVLTEIIDLGGFVREISTLVRSSIPKTVELKLELAPDLPLIEADSAQIQQVIMNLVINAAEAIGENKPGRVEVRTSVRELDERAAAEFFHPEAPAPGTYVQLLVADNGSGMDEKTRSRIFDPFFTTKFAGRGLGLAAVQGIVRAHGGSIRVYSTPGHGSTFVLLFPASRKKAPAAGQHPPRIAIREGAVALVVDDEASIRKLSRDVLTRAGMKVLLADNGREAVELFRQHSGELSVVLLDLKMPVMGGDQVLPLLREINPKVPVILSSGFNEDEAAHQFAPLEPACFLQKPYTAERLLQAVSEIIKSKES
jgi:two-component system CheB/CheR fusion protein